MYYFFFCFVCIINSNLCNIISGLLFFFFFFLILKKKKKKGKIYKLIYILYLIPYHIFKHSMEKKIFVFMEIKSLFIFKFQNLINNI